MPHLPETAEAIGYCTRETSTVRLHADLVTGQCGAVCALGAGHFWLGVRYCFMRRSLGVLVSMSSSEVSFSLREACAGCRIDMCCIMPSAVEKGCAVSGACVAHPVGSDLLRHLLHLRCNVQQPEHACMHDQPICLLQFTQHYY